MRIIKDMAIIDDKWQFIADPDETSINNDDDVIVPYKFWSANRDQFFDRKGQLSVCIEGDDPVEDRWLALHT